MEKLNLSNRDAKIHRDNPGLSPYELKALGLSEAGFKKLMALDSTDVVAVADPNIQDPPAEDPVKEPEHTAPQQPPVSSPTPSATVAAPSQFIPKAEPQSARISGSSATALRQAFKANPNQVIVQLPDGKTNTMGREYAQKLVKMNPSIKIIG